MVEEIKYHKEKTLNVLILHIANICNMACKYCFANGGVYNSKPDLMTEETALKAIEFFYSKYDAISEIKFFGGEPLCNVGVIDAVCKKVKKITRNRENGKLPIYKIITNGTLLTEENIELLLKYHIDITVSVDGPAVIHDAARKYKNGAPTYAIIKDNCDLLKKMSHNTQPRCIEVTYSKISQENGYSVSDTVQYLSETFDILPEKINLSYVQTTDKNLAVDSFDIDLEYIKNIKMQIRMGKNSYAHQKINCLLLAMKRKSAEFQSRCMAGFKWISIFYNGDIYPCYMLADKKDLFLMGNVWDENGSFDSEKLKYEKLSKKINNKCEKCIAKEICYSCIGTIWFETGDISDMADRRCAFTRKYYKEIKQGIEEGIL